MKALSIRQPWAWLIVHGFKPVENRTWPTPQRGEVLIHAGLVFDTEGLSSVLHAFPELRPKLPQQYELGGIVGVATITDCVQTHASRWFTGPYGFVMADPRPLPFARWPGKLSFFEIPDGAADLALRGGLAVPAEQSGLF
jgi:ASCH domain